MTRLVMVVFLFASTHGAAFLDPIVPRLEERIVGGYPISIREVPYNVALLLDFWGVGNFVQYCGGSIINDKVIVTAAHCTDGTSASQWKIRAGSGYHNKGGQVINVLRYVQNEEFNSKFNNDICLLHLTLRIQLSELASTVALPSQAISVPDSAMSIVTGWGVVSDTGNRADWLSGVMIPIVNQEQCVAAYSSVGTVTGNMICAGYMEGGMGACQADDGSPLVINGTLIGIVSWRYGCVKPGYPGVYTRVPMYRNWINANM